jgi:DNA-binding transcriptional regulator YhcF (GntR family)
VILEVDQRSALPPYEQLRQQITALVRAGVLAPGARLPAIRQLANDLGLAGGTVARAYRELESEGLDTTHGRHGTVVAATPPVPSGETKPASLLPAARKFAADARRVGAGLDDAIAALRAAYASEATK